MLTDDQFSHFRERGYVVIPDALNPFDVERVSAAFEQAQQQTEAAWRRCPLCRR